jgi:general stress protein CsbA
MKFAVPWALSWYPETIVVAGFTAITVNEYGSIALTLAIVSGWLVFGKRL